MKLKILITGSAPNFIARVVDQTFLGSDLLMEKGKKKKCASIDRAQQEARHKLELSWPNIPLILEWEVQQ
jgi:hypothetical protein